MLSSGIRENPWRIPGCIRHSACHLCMVVIPRQEYCSNTKSGIPHCDNLRCSWQSLEGVVIKDARPGREVVDTQCAIDSCTCELDKSKSKEVEESAALFKPIAIHWCAAHKVNLVDTGKQFVIHIRAKRQIEGR